MYGIETQTEIELVVVLVIGKDVSVVITETEGHSLAIMFDLVQQARFDSSGCNWLRGLYRKEDMLYGLEQVVVMIDVLAAECRERT
ncbi:hypothetical protein MKX03_004853 [Papaver bracteatum]|nr:hypothetical protein MKX03_004853 [Papaver bracteatum]